MPPSTRNGKGAAKKGGKGGGKSSNSSKGKGQKSPSTPQQQSSNDPDNQKDSPTTTDPINPGNNDSTASKYTNRKSNISGIAGGGGGGQQPSQATPQSYNSTTPTNSQTNSPTRQINFATTNTNNPMNSHNLTPPITDLLSNSTSSSNGSAATSTSQTDGEQQIERVKYAYNVYHHYYNMHRRCMFAITFDNDSRIKEVYPEYTEKVWNERHPKEPFPENMNELTEICAPTGFLPLIVLPIILSSEHLSSLFADYITKIFPERRCKDGSKYTISGREAELLVTGQSTGVIQTPHPSMEHTVSPDEGATDAQIREITILGRATTHTVHLTQQLKHEYAKSDTAYTVPQQVHSQQLINKKIEEDFTTALNALDPEHDHWRETDKKVSKISAPQIEYICQKLDTKLPLLSELGSKEIFNLTPGAIASYNSALTLDTFSNIYQLPNSRNKNKQERSNPSLCPDLSKTMRYDDRSGASRTYNSDFTNDQSKQRMDAFKYDRFSVMGQDMDMQSVQQHIYPQGSTFEYIQPAQIYIATIVDMFFPTLINNTPDNLTSELNTLRRIAHFDKLIYKQIRKLIKHLWKNETNMLEVFEERLTTFENRDASREFISGLKPQYLIDPYVCTLMRLDNSSTCRTYLGASSNALVQATDILTDLMVAALSNADELLSEQTSLTVFNAAGQTPQFYMRNLNITADHVVQNAANVPELGPHPYLTDDINESWRINRAVTELMRTIPRQKTSNDYKKKLNKWFKAVTQFLIFRRRQIDGLYDDAKKFEHLTDTEKKHLSDFKDYPWNQGVTLARCFGSYAKFMTFTNSYLTEMQPLQKKNAPPTRSETEIKQKLDDVASCSLVLYTNRNNDKRTANKQEANPTEKDKASRRRDSDAPKTKYVKFVDSGNELANKCAQVFHYLEQLYHNVTRKIEKDSPNKDENAVHHMQEFGLYFDLNAARNKHAKTPNGISDVIDFENKLIYPEYTPFVYVIPMISKGRYSLEDKHHASTKLERNNICTAREFTNLLDEITEMAFQRTDQDEYKYARYIYGSQQLFNQGLSAFGYQRNSGSKPPKSVLQAVSEALRIIKLSAYNRIYTYTDQASTFHASGTPNDASASSHNAAPTSDEFSPADGTESASNAHNTTMMNLSSDRTTSDSLAASGQSMSTPNSNNTLTNTDSNIPSLSSTSRDFGSLPLEDMEAIMKAKREEVEQAKESENTAYVTQLNNMPRTVIENFMRTEQLKQQQAALQATSSASSAASDN